MPDDRSQPAPRFCDDCQERPAITTLTRLIGVVWLMPRLRNNPAGVLCSRRDNTVWRCQCTG
jgi:hypothetical protein